MTEDKGSAGLDKPGLNFTVGSLRHTGGFLGRRIDFRAELGLIKAALLYADKVQLCSVGASWVESFDHIGRMSIAERAALIKDLSSELNQDFAPKELKKALYLLDKLQGPESLLNKPKAEDDVKRAVDFVDREWPKITAYVESVFDSWQIQEYRSALKTELVEVRPFSATTPQALVRQI